tara:strand:+ start:1125 stop:1334 length:210 start_codon:yes stop_codon:yes gene_type:complete
MADIERVGRRGVTKDTEQGIAHIWIGRRGMQQEQAAAAVGGGRIMSSLAGYGGLAGKGGIAGIGGGLAG